MRPGLRAAVEGALGERVRRAERATGGDLHEAWRAELTSGRRVFVKHHPRGPAGIFTAEARGLAWLREAGALRVPDVLAASDAKDGAPAFLVLELLEAGPPDDAHDELLGRGLAALHRAGAPCFGLDHDNFIGRLPQSNRTAPDWPTFLRDERLAPQLRAAADAQRLPRGTVARLEGLLADLADRTGPSEPPARLHGDLWAGNAICDEAGRPCLVDPAAYGGHREVDLAMMRLFGGFGPRVFDAYDEAYPRAEGHGARVALYQLYPLLVHVNLFGRSYARPLERALDACA